VAPLLYQLPTLVSSVVQSGAIWGMKTIQRHQ